ncbi:MAG: hypothetical protein FJ150_01280 [Euryarchaeota archaeon]|nr:hypothetical protein [Euryarchaeota archaeon]
MSYGKLNIWLKHENCNLIDDCWRTDLVIKTCSGVPVVNMDPKVLRKLKKKYPKWNPMVHDYMGERRIKLEPTDGTKINNVEVELPPGCYVVWTRVCYKGNEETNKVLVTVNCAREVCVNLILNSTKTCGKEFLYPFVVRAKKLDLNDEHVEIAAKLIAEIADIPKEELVADLDLRFKDLEGVKKAREVRHLDATKMLKKMVEEERIDFK